MAPTSCYGLGFKCPHTEGLKIVATQDQTPELEEQAT